ncbi:hypothetical protein [Sphingomonas sp.]|uniref:hypothetical protein n=1 Tax=Sphingomonas sp. TaxID=28214 RepID=UPI003D6D7874
MRIAEQQAIRSKTSAIVLEWAEGRDPPFTGEAAEGFVDAIVAADLVANEAKVILHRWIGAARRTGLSWIDIGNALGISKQAAQQRFKSVDTNEGMPCQGEEEIVRRRVSAINEMSILREEGEKGHELIRTEQLALVFRPTDRIWEYRRRIALGSVITQMTKNGWTYVSTWFPLLYFKRLAP